MAFLLQELLDLMFCEIEGMLMMFRSYCSIERVPDHSALSRELSSKRWTVVLERFFRLLVDEMSLRSVVVVTDATGYSGRKSVCWTGCSAIEAHIPSTGSNGTGASDTSRPSSHKGRSLLLPSQLPFCRI